MESSSFRENALRPSSAYTMLRRCVPHYERFLFFRYHRRYRNVRSTYADTYGIALLFHLFV